MHLPFVVHAQATAPVGWPVRWGSGLLLGCLILRAAGTRYCAKDKPQKNIQKRTLRGEPRLYKQISVRL